MPAAVVMNELETDVYVANRGSDSISHYAFDATTGELSSVAEVPARDGPAARREFTAEANEHPPHEVRGGEARVWRRETGEHPAHSTPSRSADNTRSAPAASSSSASARPRARGSDPLRLPR